MRHWNFKNRLFYLSILLIQLVVCIVVFVTPIQTEIGFQIFDMTSSLYSSVIVLSSLFIGYFPLYTVRALRDKDITSIIPNSNISILASELKGWSIAFITFIVIQQVTLQQIFSQFELLDHHVYMSLTFDHMSLVLVGLLLSIQGIVIIILKKNARLEYGFALVLSVVSDILIFTLNILGYHILALVIIMLLLFSAWLWRRHAYLNTLKR